MKGVYELDTRKCYRLLLIFTLLTILVGCQNPGLTQTQSGPTSTIESPQARVTSTARIGEQPTPLVTSQPPGQTPSKQGSPTAANNANPYLCSANTEPVIIIGKVDLNESFLFFQQSLNKKNLAEDYRPLAWSPSGKKLLVTSKSNYIYGISDWDGESFKDLPNPETGHICNYAWLTEEELLVSVCTNERGPMYNDDKTYILNVETGQYQKIGPDSVRRIQAVSPDGNVWFEQGDKLYMVRRDGTGKSIDFLPISGDFIFPLSQPALVFNPSGDTLYYFKAESKNGNMLYDLYSLPLSNQDLKQEKLLYHGFEGNSYVMRVSPDGKYMAVVIAPKDLYFVNLKTLKIDYHWEWQEKNSWPPFIFWSPDSKSIGFSSGKNTDLLYEMDISTGDTKVLLKDQGFMKILDWKCFPNDEK